MSQDTEYKNRFAAEKYDRVGLMLKKGSKELLNNAAAKNSESLNAYIKKAVRKQYKRETGNDIEL